MNPFLYYFMVRDLCDKQAWAETKRLFEVFHVPHITSCALSVIPEEKEAFHSSTTILNWWNAIEQRSIELSLEYRYMFVSDITNCYGSIIPQAFDWAFAIKGTQKERACGSGIAKAMGTFYIDAEKNKLINIDTKDPAFFTSGSLRAMAAVCVQIALENVGCCHYALRVLSLIVNSLKNHEEKQDIISKACAKLQGQPNSDYIQIWQQGITYPMDKKKGVCPYGGKLCKAVMDEDVALWNNSWLKKELAETVESKDILEREMLTKAVPVVAFKEKDPYGGAFGM